MTVRRFKCRVCGYIYSPLRGEPRQGIPAGTEFEDLPDTYVCALCGVQGKGKIGTWGFEEWLPTKYISGIVGTSTTRSAANLIGASPAGQSSRTSPTTTSVRSVRSTRSSRSAWAR